MFNAWDVKGPLALLASGMTWLLGGWDVLAQALVALIALDVVGGLMHAFVDRRLNSRMMLRGLVRKSAYFAAIGLAVLVDRAIFHGAPAFRTLVISYLCVNESLSVVEHLAGVGVPLPRALKAALERVRKELDQDEGHSPPQCESR